MSQFLGADTIDHTPKNETIRLHLGDSFDVTARKRQTDFRTPAPCTDESSYRIDLSNAKTAAQTVLVVEPIPGDWRITEENMKHTKTSSSTASWSVVVPPGGKRTLTYTADTNSC